MRSRFLLPVVVVALSCALGWLAASVPPNTVFAQDTKAPPAARSDNRLPKPDPAFMGKIGETYKDSTPSYPVPLKARKASPNVLLILLDDVKLRHVLDVRRAGSHSEHAEACGQRAEVQPVPHDGAL